MNYKPNQSAWKWIPLVLLLLFGAIRLEAWSNKVEYPSKFEIEKFPLHVQPDEITCGPTSLKMVLEHYGKVHSVDEIKKKTKTELFVYQGTKIGGTAPDQMKLGLSHFGVPCNLVHANMDQLRNYISQSKPCIVLVRSGKMLLHWIVAIGYDENNIIVANPSNGERNVLKNDIFENAWKFTHDLRGRDMSIKCPLCSGNGFWAEWMGPFGKCDACGGTGTTIDIFKMFVGLGEAQNYTVIFPKEKPHDLETRRPSARR